MMNIQVFINENKLEKINFQLEKMECRTYWELCAYTEYLALGKALLTTLYLKVKVYITIYLLYGYNL